MDDALGNHDVERDVLAVLQSQARSQLDALHDQQRVVVGFLAQLQARSRALDTREQALVENVLGTEAQLRARSTALDEREAVLAVRESEADRRERQLEFEERAAASAAAQSAADERTRALSLLKCDQALTQRSRDLDQRNAQVQAQEAKLKHLQRVVGGVHFSMKAFHKELMANLDNAERQAKAALSHPPLHTAQPAAAAAAAAAGGMGRTTEAAGRTEPIDTLSAQLVGRGAAVQAGQPAVWSAARSAGRSVEPAAQAAPGMVRPLSAGRVGAAEGVSGRSNADALGAGRRGEGGVHAHADTNRAGSGHLIDGAGQASAARLAGRGRGEAEGSSAAAAAAEGTSGGGAGEVYAGVGQDKESSCTTARRHHPSSFHQPGPNRDLEHMCSTSVDEQAGVVQEGGAEEGVVWAKRRRKEAQRVAGGSGGGDVGTVGSAATAVVAVDVSPALHTSSSNFVGADWSSSWVGAGGLEKPSQFPCARRQKRQQQLDVADPARDVPTPAAAVVPVVTPAAPHSAGATSIELFVALTKAAGDEADIDAPLIIKRHGSKKRRLAMEEAASGTSEAGQAGQSAELGSGGPCATGAGHHGPAASLPAGVAGALAVEGDSPAPPSSTAAAPPASPRPHGDVVVSHGTFGPGEAAAARAAPSLTPSLSPSPEAAPHAVAAEEAERPSALADAGASGSAAALSCPPYGSGTTLAASGARAAVVKRRTPPPPPPPPQPPLAKRPAARSDALAGVSDQLAGAVGSSAAERAAGPSGRQNHAPPPSPQPLLAQQQVARGGASEGDCDPLLGVAGGAAERVARPGGSQNHAGPGGPQAHAGPSRPMPQIQLASVAGGTVAGAAGPGGLQMHAWPSGPQTHAGPGGPPAHARPGGPQTQAPLGRPQFQPAGAAGGTVAGAARLGGLHTHARPGGLQTQAGSSGPSTHALFPPRSVVLSRRGGSDVAFPIAALTRPASGTSAGAAAATAAAAAASAPPGNASPFNALPAAAPTAAAEECRINKALHASCTMPPPIGARAPTVAAASAPPGRLTTAAAAPAAAAKEVPATALVTEAGRLPPPPAAAGPPVVKVATERPHYFVPTVPSKDGARGKAAVAAAAPRTLLPFRRKVLSVQPLWETPNNTSALDLDELVDSLRREATADATR